MYLTFNLLQTVVKILLLSKPIENKDVVSINNFGFDNRPSLRPLKKI